MASLTASRVVSDVFRNLGEIFGVKDARGDVGVFFSNHFFGLIFLCVPPQFVSTVIKLKKEEKLNTFSKTMNEV